VFGDDSGKVKSGFALGAPVLAMASGPLGVVVATGERLLAARPDGVRTLVAQAAAASVSPAAAALSSPSSDGRLFVGTATGELFELRGDTPTRVVGGLPGRVTAVASDGRRFWLGMGRAGLHLWESGTAVRGLRPAGELCDNHVVGVVRFADRTVAATFDQGACFLDGSGWHALTGLPSPMVHGLGTDGQDLYLATSNGLARYDGRMRPRPFGRGDPAVLRWLAKSAATAVAPIDERSLAMTSAYGLVEIRRDGATLAADFTSHRGGVPLKLTAVTSAEGEIWLASETQGMKSMGKGGRPVRHLQDPEDLPENWVTAVAAVAGDDLWVGTCQRGVVHVRGQSRRFIHRKNLLPDDMVVALAADARGAFIGTLGGLAFAAAEGIGGRSYGWEVGLPDPRSSALHLERYELWVGTEAGLALFGVR
jgi:ligand-binding sensor domain-containing protein